ncbi:MAG: IS200/IS605 family element RNA-guided endonuclease TnpB, partial [Methanobrevibacter sp.]
MEKAFKFRIYPNIQQKLLIHKTFGCCRFVYNQILAKRIELYKTEKKSLNKTACNNYCNQKLKQEFTWLKEVDKFALTNSIYNLDAAFQNFFREIKKGNYTHGFPHFKSKKEHHQSYKTNFTNNNIQILDKQIKLPKLGLVKCRVSKQIQGRILNTTISYTPSGKYFASVCCTDVGITALPSTGAVVGIDLGLKEFAITSDGQHIFNPKYFYKSEKRLAKYHKQLSRKTIGSKNRDKARVKVAKAYEKVNNQRTDFLQKLSTELVRNYDVICLEDLKVKNMVKNHRLAKSIHDVSWSEFVRELTYKSEWYRKTVQKIGTYYASSQLCSECGYKFSGTKNLSVREWDCPQCGAHHD